MRWISTSGRAAWRHLITVVVLAIVAAGCGAAASAGSGSTPDSGAGPGSASATTTSASTTPAVDPEVARWARRWTRKVTVPMARAVSTLAANAPLAVSGNSLAGYRLTSALTKLSNCRIPLDLGLARVPASLVRARTLSLAACRAFYVGTNTFVDGLNSGSATTLAAGLHRMNHGTLLLKRAGGVVKEAMAAPG